MAPYARLAFSLTALASLALAIICRGQSATAPAPADFTAAVAQLSSDDFAERQTAVKTLQSLIDQQTRQEIQIQQVMDSLQHSLAVQLKDLAIVRDPEAKARAAGLLEMQASLTNWVLQVLPLPQNQREKLLAWGLSPQAAPVLTRIYAHDKTQRRAGIKELAKLTGDGPDWTLAQLIAAREPAVYVTATAAVYDRPPTPEVLEALWHRAVQGHVATPDQPEPEDSADAPVEFPEIAEPIEVGNDPPPDDNPALAVIVLLHYDSPQVADRLKRFIANDLKDHTLLELFPENNILRGWCTLVERYGVKEAIPPLVALAFAADTRTDENGEQNGVKFWTSTRTMALAALLTLTDQKVEDYKITRMNNDNGQPGKMWVTDREETDKAALEKFRAWWADHHKQYGVDQMPTTAPAADAGASLPHEGMAYREKPPPLEGP